jgi:hypothetical protein
MTGCAHKAAAHNPNPKPRNFPQTGFILWISPYHSNFPLSVNLKLVSPDLIVYRLQKLFEESASCGEYIMTTPFLGRVWKMTGETV